MACVTTSDLREVVVKIVDEAKMGDMQAAALVTRYCFAAAGRRGQAVEIDDGKLDTIEGCLSASQDIFRELAAGNLDHESASALGAMVDRSMKAIQIQQGERVTDALEDMGAQIVFAEAGNIEESLREIGAAMDKRKEATDAN